VKKKHGGMVFFALLFLSLISCKQPEGGAGEEAEPYNPDIMGWRTASWSPFTVADSIKGFAWGNGTYVAVGLHGIIAYSSDGDIWERARKAPDPVPAVPAPEPFKLADGGDANFNAVDFGGGLFVAVAEGGHIAWSYDGVSWTGHEISDLRGQNINGIAYGTAANGAGCFVAVGNDGHIFAALSSNPGTWAGGKVAGFSALKDIVFGGGKFYTAGDDGWMGWAALHPSVSSTNFAANGWDWHSQKWTFSAQTGTFAPYVKRIAFGEYGRGVPGLGIVFNEWGGKRIAVCAASRFESADSTGWDSDIDAGFFDKEVNDIAWSPWDEGTWMVAGTSAMIGYWPGSAPSDQTGRYWRALSFAEFRWWEITALAALNGGYFAGGIGGKIGYRK
jgi:hypothetical protein